MNSLIEAVKQKQRQDEITDNALASLLGIDRSTWSKIKSGKRNPGMKFIRAVNERLMPVEMSDIITTTLSQTSQNGKLARFRAWLKGFIPWIKPSNLNKPPNQNPAR